MIIADTDVLIDFLKGDGRAADRIELELKQGLCTTVVTAFELWNGAIGSLRRERAIDILLGALKIIPLDQNAAQIASKVRYDLQKKGITIGMADSLIAGICISERAIFLTRKTKHFNKINDLFLGSIDS